MGRGCEGWRDRVEYEGTTKRSMRAFRGLRGGEGVGWLVMDCSIIKLTSSIFQTLQIKALSATDAACAPCQELVPIM